MWRRGPRKRSAAKIWLIVSELVNHSRRRLCTHPPTPSVSAPSTRFSQATRAGIATVLWGGRGLELAKVALHLLTFSYTLGLQEWPLHLQPDLSPIRHNACTSASASFTALDVENILIIALGRWNNNSDCNGQRRITESVIICCRNLFLI